MSELLREGKTKCEKEDGRKEEMDEKRKNSLQYWFDEYEVIDGLDDEKRLIPGDMNLFRPAVPC